MSLHETPAAILDRFARGRRSLSSRRAAAVMGEAKAWAEQEADEDRQLRERLRAQLHTTTPLRAASGCNTPSGQASASGVAAGDAAPWSTRRTQATPPIGNVRLDPSTPGHTSAGRSVLSRGDTAEVSCVAGGEGREVTALREARDEALQQARHFVAAVG